MILPNGNSRAGVLDDIGVLLSFGTCFQQMQFPDALEKIARASIINIIEETKF